MTQLKSGPCARAFGDARRLVCHVSARYRALGPKYEQRLTDFEATGENEHADEMLRTWAALQSLLYDLLHFG